MLRNSRRLHCSDQGSLSQTAHFAGMLLFSLRGRQHCPDTKRCTAALTAAASPLLAHAPLQPHGRCHGCCCSCLNTGRRLAKAASKRYASPNYQTAGTVSTTTLKRVQLHVPCNCHTTLFYTDILRRIAPARLALVAFCVSCPCLYRERVCVSIQQLSTPPVLAVALIDSPVMH